MVNLRILWNNIADSATVTASPALVTTLPESNLQTQQRKKTARSTSTASQEFRFSWASAQVVNMMAMRYHNLTAAAQLAAPTFSDAAFATPIDTNAAANCFDASGFGAEDVLTDADFRILKNSARYLTRRTNVQSMKGTVTDASNPDGYFDISRFFIGEYQEFSYQPPEGGIPLFFEQDGEQMDMADGSIVTDKREKRRRIELSHDYMPAADWARLLAGLRRVGRDKDIWIDIFPDDTTYQGVYYRGAFKLASDPTFDRHFYSLARTRLTFRET